MLLLFCESVKLNACLSLDSARIKNLRKRPCLSSLVGNMIPGNEWNRGRDRAHARTSLWATSCSVLWDYLRSSVQSILKTKETAFTHWLAGLLGEHFSSHFWSARSWVSSEFLKLPMQWFQPRSFLPVGARCVQHWPDARLYLLETGWSLNKTLVCNSGWHRI